MHRHNNGPKLNAPFKAPARIGSTGNTFSVPATHGFSSQDRIDASSSRSAWPNGNGSQEPSNNRGGYSNYNRTNLSSYGGRQGDNGWNSRGSGGNVGFGYGPSSHKVVSMVDDFPDSVGTTNDKYGVDKARQAALQRDAHQLSPGKVKAAAEHQNRMDNMHSHENKLKDQRAAEDKKNREKREQDKLKSIADEQKAKTLLKVGAGFAAPRDVSSLPLFRRTSTSSSALPCNPPTYSKKDKERRERSGSAAEARLRKERGMTDDIEDADDDSDDVAVVHKKEVRKDSKGKGKQREFTVEVSSPRRKPTSKGLPPVDKASLMLPNKPVSKSSSGRVSSPVRSSQSNVIDLADSPEKPRPAKLALPPTFEMSPSLKHVDLNGLIEQERKEEEAKAKKEEKWGEREKKRIVLSADEEEDDDGEDSEEVVRRELMEESPRGRFSKTPDPLLWAEETRADPSTLCPFCSRALPTTRSSALSNLLQYLLARPDIVDYPTARNPAGKRLPMVQTASFCRMHEEEMVIIPTGIAKGWPTEIDWDGLPKRIDRQLSQHLSEIITGKTPSPFFVNAKKEWEAKGNKMKNLLSEYSSFDVEQPGYYGSRGHELIVATVTRLFVTQTPLLAPFRCTPLDPPAYIRRVLVPETALQLIKADLLLPDDESAREVLKESRAFGRALWQGGLEGKEEERKFIKEEERRERREELEEDENQEKAAVGGGKDQGKGKEKEKAPLKEAEREKEKRREKRRKEKEIICRAQMVAKGLSVSNQSDDDAEEGGQDDRSTARRKPKVGNSAPAAPPAKRKPKQQLNSERMAVSTSASGLVNTSNGGGRSSESDSDSMEVTTIKKRKPQPKPQPLPPQVKRKPGASSTSASNSLAIPRSTAPSSSSSDDVLLPRVKAKATTKLESKAKPSSSTTSSAKSKSKSSKRPSAFDSDSDPFEEEIKTDFKKKRGKVAAPWETKRGKRKGAGGGGEDDSTPPDSDESSSSDDDMEAD